MGVPDVDESFEPRWWRKEGSENSFDDVEEVEFPDLEDDVAQGGGQVTLQLDQEWFVLLSLFWCLWHEMLI